jgi:hypothetical protein
MPTITASPALVFLATDSATPILSPSTTLNLVTSLFSYQYSLSGTPSVNVHQVLFKNSLGTTLVTSTMSGSGFTRTMASNGYVVFSNMQAVVPNSSGTIAYIEIIGFSANHFPGSNPTIPVSSPYTMTLTVGDIGSGADVEIDDLNVVSNQPWRMNGSIRWRVPNTFNYSE